MAGVFTIPAGAPFARLIAAHVIDTYRGEDPAALIRILILVPTRRAAFELRNAFLALASGRPMLLPTIRSIADGAEEEADRLIDDPALMAQIAASPPVIEPLHRQFLLTEMIQEHAQAATMDVDTMQAFGLAGTLARLLDDFLIESVPPDTIDTALNETARELAVEFAVHWQASLDVLRIVMRDWPIRLEEIGKVESALRRAEILDRFAEQLRTSTIDRPVIAAGSTGTIASAANLLEAVAGLPEGLVVLPGLDLDFSRDEAGWEAVGPDHPQATLKALLARLDVSPGEVAPWPGTEVDLGAARRRLLSEVLRPADTTDRWKNLTTDEAKGQFERELEGLSLIEAKTQAGEAQAIALILRHALEEPDRTAALVTPDRTLARRVTAALGRWNIAVDDSAGVPLTKTDAGRFLALIAGIVISGVDPVTLMALLNHPFTAGGRARVDFLADARLLDRYALRGTREPGGLDGVLRRLDRDEIKHREAVAEGGDKAAEAAGQLERCGHLKGFVAELSVLLSGWSVAMPRPARDHADSLAAVAEAIAATDQVNGADALWSGNDGGAARDLIDRLIEAGGAELSGEEFNQLLRRTMDRVAVRGAWGSHPRLAILGPAEARMIDVDVVVLGGLNEGIWPQIPETGAWLNRDMRAVSGLSPPERQIGRSAHDFVQSAAMPRVYLTRADNVDGSPQVASRWILRLKSLVGGALGADRAEAALADTENHSGLALALDAVKAVAKQEPPMPCPAVAKRPTSLSVTQIETWIRDPYAIYARHILNLEKLDPIGAAPSAMDRGIAVHRVMEDFVGDNLHDLPTDALDDLVRRGEAVFAGLSPWPTEQVLWTTRFTRAAEWFLEDERLWRDEGNTPLALEVWGRTEIDGFVVHAKADRIDQGPGGLIIQDYKTGTAPSSKQVYAGLSPQLPLEAIIARAGGFKDVGGQRVADLVYVTLPGGSILGDRKSVVPARSTRDVPGDIDEIIDHVLAGFKKWIVRFRDPAEPYPSRFAPVNERHDGNHDHLARVRAWSAGGDGDET